MDTWNLTALAVTLGLFAGLYVLGRNRLNFSVLTFVALFVGAGVGLVFRDHVDYIQPLGRVYINLLLTIVAPLVIVSILSSITSLGSTEKLRTIGTSSVVWLMGLNALAILLTLGLSLWIGVGKNADLATQGVDTRALDEIKKPFAEVFIGFFPTNIVQDISENNIIPIIVFTLLIAVACSLVADRSPEKVAPLISLIEAAREIIYKAVGFVIALTPYAVLVLTAVAASTASAGKEQLSALLGLLVVAYIACFVHAFVVNAVVLRVAADVNPVAFFRKIAPAQLTAFTTQSSAGTLPVTTSVLTSRVGVPADVAGFTAPLGTTIGMPGCAGVWPIILAVFAVNGLGIDYSLADYAVLALLSLLVSIGTAGVPGTATITATTVLAAAGLPLEVVVLTLPISAIVDMARTMNNVTAAAVAATVVARRAGRLDDVMFASSHDEPLGRRRQLPPGVETADGVPVGVCGIDDRPTSSTITR
ncbi:dicarboxylate/amino acid:cation symporter [Aeromicrobium wangtongii]|uniref:L-cystine uptake protein TcyP n=1 Tax=Aeromicrobium wangtongii TaxID=2969247 RepID=A0ABY5MA69_9ACTN|nr:dicarboxylate/amino acid:cation symporter [Aeromicrobium wangtongii]MCD9199506.1 dicarboxylate/amino acid:cation symporter [Aeromicrobium wangtongii]UUP13859.1 dicarboxylate/amino acid:cation symporter [Aeromicrobium wangtongii]